MDTKADTSQAVKVIRRSLYEDKFSTRHMPYTLVFKIVEGEAQVCESRAESDYSGEPIEIPSKISYRNTEYNVTSIGSKVFDDEQITQVVLPDTLEKIEFDSFCGRDISLVCQSSNLEMVDGVLYSNKDAKLIYVPQDIEKLEIRKGCRVVGRYACFDRKKLRIVSMPNTIVEIGYMAFAGCDCLTQINIPESVEKIDHAAFAYCHKLPFINLPDSIKKLEGAFLECINLMDITLPKGLTEIGNMTFVMCRNLRAIEIPDTVTKIGNYAFEQCFFLSTIVIPVGVTKIGNKAFNGCLSLKEIWIQNESCDYADALIPDETKVYVGAQKKCVNKI